MAQLYLFEFANIIIVCFLRRVMSVCSVDTVKWQDSAYVIIKLKCD